MVRDVLDTETRLLGQPLDLCDREGKPAAKVARVHVMIGRVDDALGNARLLSQKSAATNPPSASRIDASRRTQRAEA